MKWKPLFTPLVMTFFVTWTELCALKYDLFIEFFNPIVSGIGYQCGLKKKMRGDSARMQ